MIFPPVICYEPNEIDLQQGLSGQPLAGPDIGGFAGNATPKLFGRWMALGAMFPFCRGHSETDTIDHEPWSFGEEVCPFFEDFMDTTAFGLCDLGSNDFSVTLDNTEPIVDFRIIKCGRSRT